MVASIPRILVNGEVIDEAAIQSEAAAILKLMAERMRGEDPATLRVRAREWAEENLIEAALLRQSAASDPEPLETPPDCTPEAEMQLRLDRLIQKVTSPASRPRHKDVVAFYLKNRKHFQEPEQIRAAHIVRNVDDNNTEESAFAAITRARDELAKGRPFAEVADELSDCPGQGGDVGFFRQGDMSNAFEEIAFRLETNQISGIFRSEFGYHIATVLERKAPTIAKLEAVQEKIEETLLAEKKQKRLHQYVDNLRAKADIRKAS